MARRGKLAPKRKTKNTVQLKNKGSDGSDEDYMVSEDEEFDQSDDEYFLAKDETEECLKKKIEKVGRPRGRKRSQRRSGAVKPRKKNAAYSEGGGGGDREDDDFSGAKGRQKSVLSHDNDIRGLCGQKEEDSGEEKPRNKTRVPYAKKNTDRCNEKPRKKAKVSYREENEDSDFDDSDEDDDNEFTPDEVDVVDDEEELPCMKKNRVDKLKMLEADNAEGKKRRRNFKALKRTRRKKSTKKQALRRKNGYHAKESRGKAPVPKKTKRSVENGRGSRKLEASSKSGFVNSGLSDYEYTISEEEREQIREASEFCGRLTTRLRSSSSLKIIKEKETVPSARKHPRTKDKEKMVDMKIEVGKQVCGICLSEVGKRTTRGMLNCCSHYFCFACILEWSKVESRCPLCKQRFATISRTEEVDGGNDLKDVVIPIPERDQVYQPSEEELRSYLDPYENVLCTECRHGGDDALMLLCDLCDSPAHTYCVGLGHEVPEGNWYCDGCRPAGLASLNAHALNPTPSRRANNNLAVSSSPVRETFDLNELYVPETPLSRESGRSSSPRYSIGHNQAASGSGALTLHERRRIQQHINHVLLNYRNRQSERSGGIGPASGINLFGSQILQDVVAALQPVPVQEAPLSIHHQGRFTTSHGREVLQPRSMSLRGQVFHHQASTSTDRSLCGPSRTEFSGTTARIDHDLRQQQLCPGNRISNAGEIASLSTSQSREANQSSPQKEHVQSLVRSHLKGLSRLDLDYITFKSIARTSTHTILAAVGLEHRWNEVFPIQTRPLACDHHDRTASQEIYPVGAQCSSCFDWFIRNVVREVMSSRLPHQGSVSLSTGKTPQQE